MVWVGHQSLSDATALGVDPQHALWALDGVVDTTIPNSIGELARNMDMAYMGYMDLDGQEGC